MELDLPLACLAIVLGATIWYLVDELLQVTPRLSGMLGRFWD